MMTKRGAFSRQPSYYLVVWEGGKYGLHARATPKLARVVVTNGKLAATFLAGRRAAEPADAAHSYRRAGLDRADGDNTGRGQSIAHQQARGIPRGA